MSVCWHGDGWEKPRWYGRGCPNGDESCTWEACVSLNAGRKRSGKRWFWMVGKYRYDVGEWNREHGYADAENESLRQAQAAAERIANGRRAVVDIYHGYATMVLRELNAEKRKQQPKPDNSDSKPVEYLYAHEGCHDYDSDCWCWRIKNRRERWNAHILKFPITKKTPKRVYYIASERHKNEDAEIGYVDRVELEVNGEVDLGGGRWRRFYTLYLAPPEPPEWIREAEAVDLRALRLEAAAVHPDRGGDPVEFRERFERYERAKAAVR